MRTPAAAPCIAGVMLMSLLFAVASAQSPASDPRVHTLVATTYYRTFSRLHPVLERIRPGETVVTKTIDSGGFDDKSVRRSEPGNPLTGPFYIEGAEPGDTLVVHFLKMRMNRRSGVGVFRLGLSALAPESIEGLYANRHKNDQWRPDLIGWEIDLDRQVVRLNDPKSSIVNLEFPAKPMMGCVGVAAQGDFAPTSGPAGPYGGNLDYNEIGEGTTVWLPVYHPGALFFLGDGHAVQADGEPLTSGVEVSLDVEFRTDLIKKARLNGPRLVNANYIISIGSQPEFRSSLDRALQMATSDMVSWLIDDYKLEPWAAHQLIGMAGEYQVVTVAGSMALKVPRKYLPAKRP
jgi:amidase